MDFVRRRMKLVAYACRYGKAGLDAALSCDGELLGLFCEAVNEIVEEESRAGRR